MSQHNSDDKDFGLNRLEDLPDETTHQESPFEREFISDDRHEPIIRDTPPTDENSGAGEYATRPNEMPEKITAPTAPRMGSDFPAANKSSGHSGSNMTTALAIVALLIATGSLWLNLNPADQTPQQLEKEEPATDYIAILNDQLVELRERLAVVELEKNALNQKVSRQNTQLQQQQQKVASQVDALKAEVATLSNKLSLQIKQLAEAKPVKQQVAPKPVSKPAPAPAKKVVEQRVIQYELPAPLESLPDNSTTTGQTGWVINLVSVYSEEAASKELARLRNRGINAEVAEFSVNGKQLYRIRVGGLASREEAHRKKTQLASEYGIKDAWIQNP